MTPDEAPPSRQETRWEKFAFRVRRHIREYVIPQYGDEGDDMAHAYSAEACVEQAKKYLGRFGKNVRPGQEELDLLKAAHYIQKAHAKITEK